MFSHATCYSLRSWFTYFSLIELSLTGTDASFCVFLRGIIQFVRLLFRSCIVSSLPNEWVQVKSKALNQRSVWRLALCVNGDSCFPPPLFTPYSSILRCPLFVSSSLFPPSLLSVWSCPCVPPSWTCVWYLYLNSLPNIKGSQIWQLMRLNHEPSAVVLRCLFKHFCLLVICSLVKMNYLSISQVMKATLRRRPRCDRAIDFQ